MAQKEKSRKIGGVVGDLALTVIAVGIVGLTYTSVSGLTPRLGGTQATKDSNVLGVSTKEQQLGYFPVNASTLPFLQDYTLTGNTDLSGDASITLKFLPLEASTYDFTVVTIKNTSLEYKKLRLDPTYSLNGSYTSIKLTYAGQTTEIIGTDGMVTPLDLVIPPTSSSDLALTVQPVAKLATPATLILGFTEVR